MMTTLSVTQSGASEKQLKRQNVESSKMKIMENVKRKSEVIKIKYSWINQCYYVSCMQTETKYLVLLGFAREFSSTLASTT